MIMICHFKSSVILNDSNDYNICGIGQSYTELMLRFVNKWRSLISIVCMIHNIDMYFIVDSQKLKIGQNIIYCSLDKIWYSLSTMISGVMINLNVQVLNVLCIWKKRSCTKHCANQRLFNVELNEMFHISQNLCIICCFVSHQKRV